MIVDSARSFSALQLQNVIKGPPLRRAKQKFAPQPRLEWKLSDKPIPYDSAVSVMERRVSEIHSGDKSEMLWFLEHPPLYTAGASAKDDDLLDPGDLPVYRSGRGGQYTYHGPGQRVVYLMLDLQRRGADLHRFVHDLEQWLISTLAEFDITGERRGGRVGVWIDLDDEREAKIAAIGIRVRRWVTFHGVSLNIYPDLLHYRGIVSCGVREHGVTSLKALGVSCSMEEVDEVLKRKFTEFFEV